jgi:hypothetical protein
MRRTAALLAVVGAFACGGPTRPESPTGRLRVLFIGNSLTYVNDLPGIVQGLADAAGGEPLVVAMVARPNFNLDDHADDGRASQTLAEGGWDVVALQQGPSSQPDSREQLRRSTAAWAAEIRKVGARPALYQVWPSADRAQDFDGVIESYALAAADVNGLLFPAGEAWRAAWRRDPTLPLYGPDGFHPSVTGSYLAALVIYGRLYNRSCVGLPGDVRTRAGGVQISPAVARVLQAAADEVNGRPETP